MPVDSIEKGLSDFQDKYTYRIQEKKLNVYVFRLIYFFVFVALHLYIVLYLIFNSDQLLHGILAAAAVSLFFLLVYLPLIIVREYYFMQKGFVIAYSIFGVFQRTLISSLWENTGDITYKRLGPHIIRIGFFRSSIGKSDTFSSRLLGILLPAIASRDVYMIVGTREEIDYIENKLYGTAKEGLF